MAKFGINAGTHSLYKSTLTIVISVLTELWVAEVMLGIHRIVVYLTRVKILLLDSGRRISR